VNAYLSGRSVSDLSLEYNVLQLTGTDYSPEDWTPVDSVSWLKAMAWELGSNKDLEIERALLTPKFGADRVAELFPEPDLQRYAPIVTSGSVSGGAFSPDARSSSGRPAPLGADRLQAAAPALRTAAEHLDAVPEVIGSGGSDGGIGSNSWVISGSRTTTGAALLGNDPHLSTSIPSIFEQMGLHCRPVSSGCPFDVSGYTFSGMPGVIIGHNQQISWGLTTSYVDVEDLYLEEVRGDRVRVGRSWRPLRVRTEEIRVKGEATPRVIRIRQSRHGPLISDVDGQYRQVGRSRSPGRSYAVALAWTALRPGRTMDAIFGMDRAQDFTQFRAAARRLAAPSQNLVYADRSGNIGYQLPGAIPLRGRGDGSAPVPGWDRRYDWKGLIGFDRLPYSYNPPSGYIVAANQAVVSDDYPYPLSDGESYGWRSQELVRRITAAGRIDPATAESFFTDDRVLYADRLLPTLLKVPIRDRWVAEGQQVLRRWDRRSDPDSAGAAFFNVVMRDLLRDTFDDQLTGALRPSSSDRWYAVLSELVKKPSDPWWDDTRTRRKETRDDIVIKAITEARKEITAMTSRDPDGWQWGKLHRVTLRHQTFGDITMIDKLFNRGDYPVPGGPAVVDALAFEDASADGRDSFAVTAGPTMRMLINWADPDRSRWINQSGNSGHAYQRNYADQLPLWAAGKTLPFAYSRSAVLAAADATLTLRPTT
jgi:penicillin amidase